MRRFGIALALAAAICGCGGDKDVTRADYTAEVTRGCREFIAKERDLNNRLQDLRTEAHSADEFLAKAVPVLEELLAHQRDQLARLRKVEPPDADRAQIDKLNAEAEKRNDEIEEVLDAARARDTERLPGLGEQLRETEQRVREMAKDYGLDRC